MAAAWSWTALTGRSRCCRSTRMDGSTWRGGRPRGQRGRFDVAGRLAREHSGPMRRDETDQSAPARYRGSVEGQTMTLTIVVGDDASQTLGPFELTLGSAGRLMKCR